MKHVAGADNVVATDFNRCGMLHRPCCLAYRARDYPFALPRLVAICFGCFAGVVDERRPAVNQNVFRHFHRTAQICKNRKRPRCCQSGNEAEIRQDADHSKTAVFTGDFVRSHQPPFFLSVFKFMYGYDLLRCGM